MRIIWRAMEQRSCLDVEKTVHYLHFFSTSKQNQDFSIWYISVSDLGPSNSDLGNLQTHSKLKKDCIFCSILSLYAREDPNRYSSCYQRPEIEKMGLLKNRIPTSIHNWRDPPKISIPIAIWVTSKRAQNRQKLHYLLTFLVTGERKSLCSAVQFLRGIPSNCDMDTSKHTKNKEKKWFDFIKLGLKFKKISILRHSVPCFNATQMHNWRDPPKHLS